MDTDGTGKKETYIYRRSENQGGLEDKLRGLEVEARQMKKSGTAVKKQKKVT